MDRVNNEHGQLAAVLSPEGREAVAPISGEKIVRRSPEAYNPLAEYLKDNPPYRESGVSPNNVAAGWERGLDQAGLVEEVRRHQAELSEYLASEFPGDEAHKLIDDPLTGNVGIFHKTQDWIKNHTPKDYRFRAPETAGQYQAAVAEHDNRILAESARRQAEAEAAYRDQVLEQNIISMVDMVKQAPSPETIKNLDDEIEISWAGPEDLERKTEIRDKCYQELAQNFLSGSDTALATDFVEQYGSRFKPETLASIQGDILRREAELNLGKNALAEILPSLVNDEKETILNGGRGKLLLDSLLSESNSFLPPEQLNALRQEREQTQNAQAWLDQPDNAFTPFPELLNRARKQFAETDKNSAAAPADGTPLLSASGRLVEEYINQRWQKLNEDPLGYVAPQVENAVNQFIAQGGLNPDDEAARTQARIALGCSLAQKMGVKDHSQVLSHQEAETLLQELDQMADPSRRFEKLCRHNENFGRYADQAFRQLGIPSAQRLAVSLGRNADPSVRQLAGLGFKHLAKPAEFDSLEKITLAYSAQFEADYSQYGQALWQELLESNWDDIAPFEELCALRALSQAVAVGAFDGGGQYGDSPAQKLLSALHFADKFQQKEVR